MIYLVLVAFVVIVLFLVIRKSGTADTTIKVTEKKYWDTRKNYPGLDEHQYLAAVYKQRMKARARLTGTENQQEDIYDMGAYSYTLLFSVLPPPDSIRALALHIVYQEDKNYIASNPQLIAEYNNLVGNVQMLYEKNPEEFFELYKKRNPNSASYYDIDDLTQVNEDRVDYGEEDELDDIDEEIDDDFDDQESVDLVKAATNPPNNVVNLVYRLSELSTISSYAPIDSHGLVPDWFKPKYKEMSDMKRADFHTELLIFDIFCVMYVLQAIDIDNEYLKLLQRANYELLKKNPKIMYYLKERFWGGLDSLGNSKLSIDIHPDVIMAEYEKHQNKRFLEYYQITGGIQAEIDQYSFDRLGYTACNNIFQIEDTMSSFMSALILKARYAFFSSQIAKCIEQA